MNGSDELAGFYEETYSAPEAEAEQWSRWRALGAVGKADHVVALCRRAAVAPASVLDIGCGDGALLSELHTRGFAPRLCGLEISGRATAIARGRPGIESVDVYDGAHVPFGDASFDLAILSHVLEHVRHPPALLAEAARACRAVLFEVPLEANWSARRAGKRVHADEVGHLQRLDRDAARALAPAAGLAVAAELDDALPLAVHRFLARGARARGAASAKWAVRAGAHKLAPVLARRAFTVHYAALCVPLSAGGRPPAPGA